MNELKKILMVFGTRPEAIKMAPLYHELLKRKKSFKVVVCVTGQHKEMLNQVLKVFKIKPDINLKLMKKKQDLFDISSSSLMGIRKVLIDNKPDLVLVHGDTTTSFIAALSSYYLNIPIGHVEAGLRTHDIFSPFPEEFNRQTIGKLANFHFVPTKNSKINLLNEGISTEKIFVTGNTVIDSLFFAINQIENDPKRKTCIEQELDKVLNFNWRNDKFVLITGHRRENFGQGFIEICNALRELSMIYKDIHFVYPVHLNPNVQVPVNSMLKKIPNIHLIDPLNYEPFIYILKYCHIVLTDSGGIQEEAPSLGKPVIVMRDSTERPEAVDAGTVVLSGANLKKIVHETSKLIENKIEYEKMSFAHNPYGNGDAAIKIVDALESI